jgi:predicted nucleotide-binding protein
VVYNDSFAGDIAAIARIESAHSGQTLIRQDDSDDDILFVLAGRVSIVINGREIAIRVAGQHVGDMALIDPSARRSASAIAIEETVVARVSESEFTRLAEKYPKCWRLMAKEIADRLRQRSRFVTSPNPRPVVFVGSSTESAAIAEMIGSILKDDDLLVRVWTNRGIFGASNFPIENLEDQIHTSDFALIVITPDDTTISRGVESPAPRDNAVFELGLFMGSLSRKRTFLVVPNGVDVKIPSDLLGLTQLRYTIGTDGNLVAALSPLCEDLRDIVARLGVR